MRVTKLYKRPKAKNGVGRSVPIKHILLPEEVVEDLRLYKETYSICLAINKDEAGNPIPVKVTFEQMLRRWMDNVGRFDPDVKKAFERAKQARATMPQMYPVDPTEGDVWKMQYSFERDGEEMAALVGELSPFYAIVDGDYYSLIDDGWTLMNDAGIEITSGQAEAISNKIKMHKS